MYLLTTYEPEPRPKPELIFADRKGGLPHSEIFGSKGARASPKLIAACHVLHRLSTPRHPSEALMRLIVLSKTHAWGRLRQPGTKPADTPIHALCLCQTMMSSQIPPPNTAKAAPGKPFTSQCHKAFLFEASRARPNTLRGTCENLRIAWRRGEGEERETETAAIRT